MIIIMMIIHEDPSSNQLLLYSRSSVFVNSVLLKRETKDETLLQSLLLRDVILQFLS